MAKRKLPAILGDVSTLDDLQGLCGRTYASWDDDELGAKWNSQICTNIGGLFSYLQRRIGAKGIRFPPYSTTDISHPNYGLPHVYLEASRVPGSAVVGIAPNIAQPTGITVFSASRPFSLLGEEDHVFLDGLVHDLRAEELIEQPCGYVILTVTAHPDATTRKWKSYLKDVGSIIRQQRLIEKRFKTYEQESIRRGEDGLKVD